LRKGIFPIECSDRSGAGEEEERVWVYVGSMVVADSASSLDSSSIIHDKLNAIHFTQLRPTNAIH
jgi:hypothetical protein